MRSGVKPITDAGHPSKAVPGPEPPGGHVMLKLMDVLGEALAAARRIEDAGARAETFVETIAEAQMKTGDTQGALATAKSIEDATPRAWALEAIAKALVEAANQR